MGPLLRRIPRQIRHNLGKYLGLFLLLVLAIGLVSGFLTVAKSVSKIIEGMDEAYHVEDGRITLAWEATDEAADIAEDEGFELYENFSLDVALAMDGSDDDLTVRVYEHRTEVNIAAYAQGSAPAAADEIAIDRVFAANNGLTLGDTIEVAGCTMTICGILTLPDYQALFETNDTIVFNAISFCVAEVTPEGFEALAEAATDTNVTYTYSFTTTDPDMALDERVDAEADLLEALADAGITVTDILDASSNQALNYISDDIDRDTELWSELGMIIIAIMAFMFVVITSSTIEDESAAIGTLLASGYRRGELAAHYLAVPCLVGLAAAVVGNLMGYLLCDDLMISSYYTSYSLPPYEAYWDWGTFAFTTVLPLVLLVGISWLGLEWALRRTPLQFLRHETGRTHMRRALHLPDAWGFEARFRVRLFVRNLGSFVTLFLGVGFASLILLFSICIMPSMDAYTSQLRDTVPAEHLYTLKAPLELEGTDEEREAWAALELLSSVEDTSELGLDDAELAELAAKAATVDADAHAVNTTDNGEEAIAQAEKFAVYSLTCETDDGGSEPVSAWGIQEGSRYWTDVDVSDGTVCLGLGMAEKYGLAVGDVIELYDKYENETRAFTVGAIVGSSADMGLYLSLEAFNEEFGYDEDYFNGWASDEELTLDTLYLAGETTPDDMDAAAAQMSSSMSAIVDILVFAAVAIFVVFMYLLTKIVIDRSARSISHLKVFGYRDREIDRLYLRTATIVVCVSLVACLPVVYVALLAIWSGMMSSLSGNVAFVMPAAQIAIDLAAGLASYLVVAALHTRSIRRVPLELALKVQD